MSDAQTAALREILAPDLAHYAERLPDMMAQELVMDDRGFIARFQLCEALLSQITPEMKGWATPDVLRAVYPDTPFSKTRMQPIAGALGAVSCNAYPQLSYYPYMPVEHMAEGRKAAPLIIAVHGSSRNPKDYRDLYAEFAESAGCFVLAPLFPLDLATAAPDEEYKYLVGDKTRYDHALWAMVDELSQAADVEFSSILFFGFSGGAQFGHRIFYACPERFAAMSFAAPGFITLPTDKYNWWVGLKDFETLFGMPVQEARLKDVKIQLMCGAEDTVSYEIYSRQEMEMSDADYEQYGVDRMSRIRALKKSYDALGLDIRLDVVPDAAHTLAPLIEASKPFFRSILEA